MNCPNCDTPSTGRYCAACGQDNRRTALRLVDLGGDLVNEFSSFDSRFCRTIHELTVNPGGVVRRYNDGKRRSYVNPLCYVLVMAARRSP